MAINDTFNSSQISIASQYVQGVVSGTNNVDLASSSFKEVLKQTYKKMDDISLQLADDNLETVMIDDTEVNKSSASASFLISQKMSSFQEIITMMMDILTKSREWDKSLGQSMSR